MTCMTQARFDSLSAEEQARYLDSLPEPEPQRIDAAIDGYAQRTGAGNGAAPYNSESLAEIYAPRVQELFDLQSQGFTHAVWKWDREARLNRWHGVPDPEEAP